jgi:DNA-binding CsgD family transcriptional regulator
MPWLELLVPFLVIVAATSCLTIAAMVLQKGGPPWERSLLEFLAASAGVAVLSAVGIFLRAAGLIDAKILYPAVGNLAFLMLSLTSWTAIRTGFLVTGARPGAAVHTGFWTFTIVGYSAVVLVAAGAKIDLYFPYVGGVYAAMSLYLTAGLGFALAVVWRRRDQLAPETRGVLHRFLKVFLPLGVIFLIDELIRTAMTLPWIPLLPLAPLTLYAFVTAEMFAQMRRRTQAPKNDGLSLWQTVADEIASLCRAAPLTKREREVLLYLLVGLNNTAVSTELQLSQNTVKNHVYNIFQKVGVGSRSELALLADSVKNQRR